MSTTVGLGWTGLDADGCVARIPEIGVECGYALEEGVGPIETDAEAGIRSIAVTLDLDRVLCIRAPADHIANDAYAIERELEALELEGTAPPFFRFLTLVSEVLSARLSEFYVFLAGEWRESEAPRYIVGSPAQIVQDLLRPGNWPVRYLRLPTGRVQSSDESPLLARILLSP